MYLSTAPYLSFAGAHLPRLRVPVPLHCCSAGRIAFRTFRWLARHAPWTLREPAHENSFIRWPGRASPSTTTCSRRCGSRRLRGPDRRAPASRIVREQLHVTGTVRRLPARSRRWLRDSPLTQDALIGNMEYVPASVRQVRDG